MRPLLAAAASLALIAGGLIAMGNRYPDPEMTGPCRLVNGNEPRRGALVATDAGRGRLALGGYCRVRLDPRSRVRLEGAKYQEQVLLEQGGMR